MNNLIDQLEKMDKDRKNMVNRLEEIEDKNSAEYRMLVIDVKNHDVQVGKLLDIKL